MFKTVNLSQLDVLIAIVDTGSLTEAAHTVGLTQSAVSYSLNRLEAELGVTLLERGRQGVVVTRIGEEVLHHARIIIQQAAVIQRKTARERGLSVGKLRFGCVPDIPPRLLTGILRDFRHQYPDIEIVQFEGNPLELMQWLEEGIIDVGTTPTNEGYTQSVPLARIDVRVCLPRNHRLASQTSVTDEDIADEVMIAPKAEYYAITQSKQTQTLKLPRLIFEVSTHRTIFAMVREEMGIALIPDMFITGDEDDIVILPFASDLRFQVYLASHSASPAIRAFMESAHQWALEHRVIDPPLHE